MLVTFVTDHWISPRRWRSVEPSRNALFIETFQVNEHGPSMLSLRESPYWPAGGATKAAVLKNAAAAPPQIPMFGSRG